MTEGIFPELDDDILYFSRVDEEEPFSSFHTQSFKLDERDWPTVEHYFQAMKFNDEKYQEKIRLAQSPKKARKLGRTRFKSIRKDWSACKDAYMTRALYTKYHTHPELASNLLDTGNIQLRENGQYDYYWGCGRDRRGLNKYGEILMNIRNKLRSELAEK